MRDDVRRLMSRAGWIEGAYVEVAALQGAAEATNDWPLLATVNRRLRAAGLDATTDKATVAARNDKGDR